MALNIWSVKCSDCKAPCTEGFKRCARLPGSGVDIYQYSKTNQSVQISGSRAYNTYLFHHRRYEDVNRQTLINELNKYRTQCTTCRCIMQRVTALIKQLDLVSVKGIFAVCEHCQTYAPVVPCKRCEYIKKKFQCCNDQMEERHRRFIVWISKIKQLLQSILNASHLKYYVTDSEDLQELARLLGEIYPLTDAQFTPRIEGQSNLPVCLSKLQENREILRKILECMEDECPGMTCSDQCPCMLRSRFSKLSLVLPQRPTLLLPPPPPPSTATSKESKKLVDKENTPKLPQRPAAVVPPPPHPPKVTSKKTAVVKEPGKDIVPSSTRSEDVDKQSEMVTQQVIPEEKNVRGFFMYQLSDKKFIDNGWTRLPMLATVRLYDVYKTTPYKGHDDWMTLNRDKDVMFYDTGAILALFKKNGAVTWYYHNGMVALVYNGHEETNADSGTYVLYSFEVDTRKKQSVLAKFDGQGNGVVYDRCGNERYGLRYNQNWGELLDKSLGPFCKWRWHNMNEPPVNDKKFMETYEVNPDPRITEMMEQENVDTESETTIEHDKTTDKIEKMGKESTKTKKRDKITELMIQKEKMKREAKKRIMQQEFQEQQEQVMLEIEKNNKTREFLNKCKKFQLYEIKMKAVKINEFFSLKIMSQREIVLRFADGSNWYKLDLGSVVHCDTLLGKDSEIVSKEPMPKVCHPEWFQ